MKISIRDLKNSFLEKINIENKIQSHFYFYESKNSNLADNLVSSKKIS